ICHSFFSVLLEGEDSIKSLLRAKGIALGCGEAAGGHVRSQVRPTAVVEVGFSIHCCPSAAHQDCRDARVSEIRPPRREQQRVNKWQRRWSSQAQQIVSR